MIGAGGWGASPFDVGVSPRSLASALRDRAGEQFALCRMHLRLARVRPEDAREHVAAMRAARRKAKFFRALAAREAGAAS